MAKIGLFYGTTTGKTETVAEMIRAELGLLNYRLSYLGYW
jgi:flavodoxin